MESIIFAPDIKCRASTKRKIKNLWIYKEGFNRSETILTNVWFHSCNVKLFSTVSRCKKVECLEKSIFSQGSCLLFFILISIRDLHLVLSNIDKLLVFILRPSFVSVSMSQLVSFYQNFIRCIGTWIYLCTANSKKKSKQHIISQVFYTLTVFLTEAVFNTSCRVFWNVQFDMFVK